MSHQRSKIRYIKVNPRNAFVTCRSQTHERRWGGNKEGKKYSASAAYRKIIKRVLDIPVTATTEKLELVSVHNTPYKVIEAQRAPNALRLPTTRTRHQILCTPAYRAEDMTTRSIQLPDICKGNHIRRAYPTKRATAEQ